ncbi:MAG: excinuclease ABC subunit UvrC [Patescibacteria group bacterium]|jgi:excinuclease ABC subunit C
MPTLLKLNNLPTKPGIYRFLDKTGRLLYIGKAKNLKNRVKSYFVKTTELSPAKQQMVQKINKVEYTLVNNETEALLLERSLIKKFQPPYNVDLKDDKSWLYAQITKTDFPQVILTRKKENHQTTKKDNQGRFFGPYTSALAIRQTLRMLKRIFPYYTESGPMINLAKNTTSRLHLGRYLNQPLTDKKEWQKNIGLIKKFLAGKNAEFKIALQKNMATQAKKKNFERAGLIRDQLKYLEIVNQKQRVIKNNEVDEGYLAKVKKKYLGLKELQKVLKLPKTPLRIECYDISNIGGQMAVGSMVVLTNGEPDNSSYRRFKIKTVIGANDPAMIAEVIKRRLHNDWPKPDLILIDGGPTQLNAAVRELKKAGFKLPIVSLAKREEEIYLPNEAIPIKLPKFSSGLQLLQRIRDEAHRFAITYYRKLHSKKYLE